MLVDIGLHEVGNGRLVIFQVICDILLLACLSGFSRILRSRSLIPIILMIQLAPGNCVLRGSGFEGHGPSMLCQSKTAFLRLGIDKLR